MQLISKFSKGIRFLLCVVDIFSKYAWVIPLKDKKGVTTVDGFQEILDDSKRKPNKIRVDKGSKFYNRSMISLFQDNNIEMYSTHNEGKSVVAERFIKTLQDKIYKHMTSILKNVYLDNLDNIVNKNNNTYHRAIKMKPVDIRDNIFISFNKEVNDKDPKFKISDYVRISKYKNIFAKEYNPNWSEEAFVIKKVENTVPWTYVISDLNSVKIIGTFCEKELKNTNQKNLG